MGKGVGSNSPGILAHLLKILPGESVSIVHIQANIPVRMQEGRCKEMKDQSQGARTKEAQAG